MQVVLYHGGDLGRQAISTREMLFVPPLRRDENLQARVELLESSAPEAPFKVLVGNRREPLPFLVCPPLGPYSQTSCARFAWSATVSSENQERGDPRLR